MSSLGMLNRDSLGRHFLVCIVALQTNGAAPQFGATP